MKTQVLIITVLFSVVTTSAFSEEVKTLDLKAMAEMVKVLKRQEALLNDPEAMAAMNRMAYSLRKAHPDVLQEGVPQTDQLKIESNKSPESMAK